MPPFTLNLKLDAAECLRGESVFFTAVLENSSGAPVRNVQTLNPDNHVFELRVEGAGVRRSADGHAPDERDGKHYHGPLEKEVRLLNPRDAMSTRGDLLAWFGELPPGNYDVHAHFTQEFLEAHSAPVKLRVLPASVAGSFVPRFGEPLRYAQRPAAWV